MLDAHTETAIIPESIKTLITVTITVTDICKILENSNMKTATIPESIKTLITVMDICEISENSNTEMATTPV